jgi:hypothetical protein
MKELDNIFENPMQQLNKLAKVKKIPCDCVGGTSELVCDETNLFDVTLIDGVLEISTCNSIAGGFENFRCTHCGMVLDNKTCEFDIQVIN